MDPGQAEQAVFEPDGELLVPSVHATSPWDVRFQHGGAVSALVARAAEMREFDVPMQVSRIAVDLVRPVPLAPLAVEGADDHGSRNVRRTLVRVRSGDELVAEARVLHIRAADLTHEPVEPPRHERPGPDDGTSSDFPAAASADPAFHRTGMELRFVKGGFDVPGPATAWFRFRRPLVAGEAPTPLQTVAAASDFGNGISWTLRGAEWIFINPDLTIHLARPPAGEWVGNTAVTVARPNGSAYAEGTLFDDEGRVGRSVQSLFVDARR